MMKLSLLLLPSALAFVHQAPSSVSTLSASKEDMIAVAEANPDFLGKTIGFWCAESLES